MNHHFSTAGIRYTVGPEIDRDVPNHGLFDDCDVEAAALEAEALARDVEKSYAVN